jgi:hypothetical protein
MNDNINMDSTIARSINNNINIDSTIARSMNDKINTDSTIARLSLLEVSVMTFCPRSNCL